MQSKSTSLIAGAVLLLGSSGAAQSPPRDPVQVRKDHPRLLAPAELTPVLTARARGPLRRMYEDRVLRDADGPWTAQRLAFTVGNPSYLLSRTLALLLSVRIEGRAEHRAAALQLAGAVIEAGPGKTRRDARIRLQALALLHDWLHPVVGPAERELLRSGLAAALEREMGRGGEGEGEEGDVSGHQHFSTASIIFGLLSLHDGSPQLSGRLTRALERWERFVSVARYVAADGGYILGWRYGRSYAARFAWVSEAIATATDDKVFQREEPWLSRLGEHLIHGLRPDHTYFRVGDTHRDIHVGLEEDLVLLGITSARYRKGALKGFAERIADFCLANRSLVPDAEFAYALLFLDPSLGAESVAGLPLVRGFAHAGNYVFRTGWEEGDTAILFRAMPWYHFNHEHRDFGSFLIYHRGGLAVQGGLYMGADEETLYGGSHLRNYAWRTVAHNSITVFDPGERFCAPAGKGHERCEGENRWANDGGQKIRSTVNDDVPVPRFQPAGLEDILDPRFQQGEVLAFEDLPKAALVVADGARAYRADKVRRFVRSFIVLKEVRGRPAPVVVIHDVVEAARPELRKAWLLHVLAEPEISGRTFQVRNTSRVRFAGDVRGKPTDYTYQYGGLLHVETLLPAEAELEVIGGPGKELWVDGHNETVEVREVDQIVEPGFGRVEVRPRVPSAVDDFLHVLAPQDALDARGRPLARLLPATQCVACTVEEWVIVVARRERPAGLSYSVPGNLAPGLVRHLVVGLQGGARYRLAFPGGAGEVSTASSGGTLQIAPPPAPGEYTLTRVPE